MATATLPCAQPPPPPAIPAPTQPRSTQLCVVGFGFQARASATATLIEQAVVNASAPFVPFEPNAISIGDGCNATERRAHPPSPTMAYAATHRCGAVQLIPDFTFVAGHGDHAGFDSYDNEASAMAVAAARAPATTRCGWMGNAMTALRMKLARISSRHPELLEAR